MNLRQLKANLKRVSDLIDALEASANDMDPGEVIRCLENIVDDISDIPRLLHEKAAGENYHHLGGGAHWARDHRVH
jgi:hypothetical protein